MGGLTFPRLALDEGVDAAGSAGARGSRAWIRPSPRYPCRRRFLEPADQAGDLARALLHDPTHKAAGRTSPRPAEQGLLLRSGLGQLRQQLRCTEVLVLAQVSHG